MDNNYTYLLDENDLLSDIANVLNALDNDNKVQSDDNFALAN